MFTLLSLLSELANGEKFLLVSLIRVGNGYYGWGSQNKSTKRKWITVVNEESPQFAPS